MSIRGYDDSISVVGNKTGLVDVSTCTDANEYSEISRQRCEYIHTRKFWTQIYT